MATCANQNQARICVAGSLWGLCGEAVFPDGLLVRTTLNAPNGAFLVDALGQCSDLALSELSTLEVVADVDGCWRTCQLVPNIGTTPGTYLEPGNTSYTIQVYDGSSNQLLYQSEQFVIDADLVGTYPVDGNGCVQLCVLSPPATQIPSNPFCDAVRACETPWIFTADPSGILVITPGDNPVGDAGNGHAPAFEIDGVALCNYIAANCAISFVETTFTGVDGYGIGFTAGGTAGHAPTVDFVPSTDPGQAIQPGALDGQPYVGNPSLEETAPNSGTLTFVDSLGVSNVLDICQIIADAACAGSAAAVSAVTPNLPAGTWDHFDGVSVTVPIVSTSAAPGQSLGIGPDGGSFLQLNAGANVVITPAGGGVYTIAATPGGGSTSVVTPNLASGIWDHFDGVATTVPIVSTSADIGNDLVPGTDGGSFLEIVAGVGVAIGGGGGTLVISATGSVSVVTPNLATGTWVHDDGQGTLVPIVSTSADPGNDLVPGTDGGSFLNLQAGSGITIAPGAAGVYTVAADPITCNDVQALFPSAARLITGTDEILVDDGAGNCDKVSPAVRYVLNQSYSEYCPTAVCVPPIPIMRDGTITALGVSAASVSAGGAELWTVHINGVASAATVSLGAGNTIDVATAAVAVTAGDVVTLIPTGPAPGTPSQCGSISIEIAEAL